MENPTEWCTPEFEEIILNCEVSAYSSGEYGSESQGETN